MCGYVATLVVVLAFTTSATEAYGQAGYLSRDPNVSVDMSVLDELGLPPTVAGQYLSRVPALTRRVLFPPSRSASMLTGPLAVRRFNQIPVPGGQVPGSPKPRAAPFQTFTDRAPTSFLPAPVQVEMRSAELATSAPPTPAPTLQPALALAAVVPAPSPKVTPIEEEEIVFASLTNLAELTDVKKQKRFAITAYGGLLTNNDWHDVFTGESLDFPDSWLVALAGSKELGRVFDHLVIELEGQVVRHLGEQDHWEFNVPVVFRWEKFPWDNVVDTSLAYGIGPSYATKVPAEEAARKGDSQQWLVYWMFEIGLGLPQSQNWSVIARLHHRSGAWGVVADDGGSNVLALGLKRRF